MTNNTKDSLHFRLNSLEESLAATREQIGQCEKAMAVSHELSDCSDETIGGGTEDDVEQILNGLKEYESNLLKEKGDVERSLRGLAHEHNDSK